MAKRTSIINAAAVRKSKRARKSNDYMDKKNLEKLEEFSSSRNNPVDNFNSSTDDWRSGCTIVKELWSKAQITGRFCDVRLLVGPEDSATMFKAHKVFLACASPVFEAMFFGHLAETGDYVPLPGDDPEGFKLLLSHVYGNQVYFPSFCSAMKTYALAGKYLIPDLQLVASTYMGGIMNDSDFWEVMKANLFCDTNFKDMCIKYISKNAHRLLALDSFLEVPKELVEVILKIDNIQIRECHLLKSVTRWCYANITDEKSRKEELKNFFNFIRFANLNATEFCDFIDEFPYAINTEDCLNLLKYYNCRGRYELPSWCSANTERRFSGDEYSSYSNLSIVDSDEIDSVWDDY